MAKLKYDVANADISSAEAIPAGIYTVGISDVTIAPSKSSGADMMTVEFSITSGDHKGRKFWHYILLDGSQDWRLREFTDALGLKTKGELDTDKIKGMVVQVKSVIDPAKDGYDAKGRVKNVLPATDADGGDDDEEEELPYDEWETSELKEEVEARDLTIPGKKTKAAMIRALEADDAAGGEEDEEEEEEPEEEEDEDDDRPDLDGMDRAALKAYIKAEGVEVKVMTKDTEETLRDKIKDALGWDDEAEEEEEEEEEEPEEEDDESDEDTPPYPEWDIDDLKNELKERGLKTDGRKSSLVKRLENDDAKNGDPF